MRSVLPFTLLFMVVLFSQSPVHAKLPLKKELIQRLQQAEALITALVVEYSEDVFRYSKGTAFDRRKNRIKIIAEVNGRAKGELQSDTFKMNPDGEEIEKHEVESGVFDGTTCYVVRGQSGGIYSHSYNLPWNYGPEKMTTCYVGVSVSKLLSDEKIEIIKEVDRGGRTMLLVETKTRHSIKKEFRFRFEIDPERNYIVVKKSQLIRFPSDKRWIEIASFIGFNYKEVEPEVWLPRYILSESFHATEEMVKAGDEIPISKRHKIKIKSWEVNPKIVETTFAFKFPPGIPFENHRNKPVPLSNLAE